MGKKYLRAKDVAEKTGLALQTIYQYVSENKIPHFKFGKRMPIFDEEKIEDWIENKHKS